MLNIPEEIIAEAKAIISKSCEEWIFPRERWTYLSPGWEVRVWTDGATGKKLASIYSVREDGRTLPSDCQTYEIEHSYRKVSENQWVCSKCGFRMDGFTYPLFSAIFCEGAFHDIHR